MSRIASILLLSPLPPAFFSSLFVFSLFLSWSLVFFPITPLCGFFWPPRVCKFPSRARTRVLLLLLSSYVIRSFSRGFCSRICAVAPLFCSPWFYFDNTFTAPASIRWLFPSGVQIDLHQSVVRYFCNNWFFLFPAFCFYLYFRTIVSFWVYYWEVYSLFSLWLYFLRIPHSLFLPDQEWEWSSIITFPNFYYVWCGGKLI